MVGPAFALAGAIAFSFKAILVKLAYGFHAVDPLTLLALRMLYAAPFYTAILAWSSRGAPRVRGRDWMLVLALGCIGYYLSSYLDFLGLQYISAALERLVLFTYPTLVALLSAIFLARPITRRTALALAITYFGVTLVFWHDLRLARDVSLTLLGSALVFGSALLYAVYLVCAGPMIERLGTVRFTAGAMLASTGFVAAQFTLTRPLEALAQPASIHLIGATMAVVCTVLPSFLIAEAVRRIGANHVSMMGSVGPLSTVIFGALLLGEPIGVLQVAGGVAVVGGVLLLVARQTGAADSRPRL